MPVYKAVPISGQGERQSSMRGTMTASNDAAGVPRSYDMQMIEAVIKPHKLDAVKTALAKIGILGVTAVECKGFGRQMGHTERYRGAKMDVGFVPKVLLKICVKGEESARAVTEIMEAARTGEVGDGKIFVYPVAEVIRIRTGEKNEQAL